MIAVLIHITDIARRAARKLLRGLQVIVESYHEGQAYRRSMPRLYMEE